MDSNQPLSSRNRTEAPASQLTAQLEQSQVRGNELPQASTEHLQVNISSAECATGKSIPVPEGAAGTSSRCSTPLHTRHLNQKNEIPSSLPATPQRGGRLAQGLSLHVPQRVFNTPSNSFSRVPASPKLDAVQTYTSPSSVLPRRSRGLDFSRASTNLHHYTLAEASPDSSPVVSGRGVTIPQRRSANGCFASPNSSHGHIWSAPGHAERNTISGSVSSINMLDSESSSCSDDDDDASLLALEGGESAAITPHAAKTIHDLSSAATPNAMQNPMAEWMHGMSTTKPSLMSFQRARYRGRTRHSSTSTSANSSGPSPGPRSPPVAKSIETFPSGYFSKEAIMADVKSRRESLSLGTNDLQLSDLSDDGDNKQGVNSSSSGGANPELARRGVIRRAVTRRGNLLPKSKSFARIKADLVEECAPVESEVKKEAEVIRQVRESDSALPRLSPSLMASAMPLPSTARENAANTAVDGQSASSNFSQQASANSGGVQFWNSFDHRYQTPPPSTHTPKDPYGDMAMETPPGNSTGPFSQVGGPMVAQSRPLGPQAVLSQAATDLSQRLSKRRRVDDLDLDLASFKRRAVSPGTSAQSSPSQSQAFSFSENGQSGHLSRTKLCSGSTQSTSSGYSQPIKRVGLQNMNETSEGFMNMSID